MFGPDEEGLLREAALAAGFEEAEVVSEPEAAARAWLAETGEAADEVIVLDCGGGTVDWAWLRRRDGIFRLVADCPPDGRRDVGGHDVDEALLEAVREALTGDAEALREIEAERPRYLARVRGIKESVGQGRAPRPLRVGRREVALDAARVQAAAEAWLVTRTLEGFSGFLDRVRAERRRLGHEGAEPPVLLVGGSARLPGLEPAVAALGCRTTIGIGRTSPTVLGAAVADGEAFRTLDLGAASPRALETWAKEGNADACFELGRRLLAEAADAQAAPWFCEAAQRDHVQAAAALGQMHEEGRGVSQDMAEAAKWYRQAADQGHPLAQSKLGTLYADGNGVPKDPVEAAIWYRRAADQGEGSAQHNLSLMYRDGVGVRKDPAEAMGWLRKAATVGFAQAQYDLGRVLLEDLARQPEAGVWLQRAAEQGHAEAQNSLGRLYDDGKGGMPKDDRMAVRWYRAAAEQGHREAQHNLGLMYLKGEGVPKRDEAEGERWPVRSAEQGGPKARKRLGDLNKAHRDLAAAAGWFRRAAIEGHGPSAVTLGEMCEEGTYQPDDKAERVRWLRAGAEAGHSGAQHQLGLVIRNGEGIAQDLKEAVRWLQAAVNAGVLQAQMDLAAAQYELGCQICGGGGAAVGPSYWAAMAPKVGQSGAGYWFAMAAEQGYAPARLPGALAYFNGQSVEQNFGKVVRLLEYDVGSRWNIVWELSQLRIALSAGDLAKADECSKTILRRVAGQEKFDSPEAIAALPAEVLLVVDATWRWAGNGRLADRRWVRKPSRGKITTFVRFSTQGWLRKRGLVLCGSGLLGSGAIVGLAVMLAPGVGGPVALDAPVLWAEAPAVAPVVGSPQPESKPVEVAVGAEQLSRGLEDISSPGAPRLHDGVNIASPSSEDQVSPRSEPQKQWPKPRIFIHHSSRDRDLALRLATRLNNAGFGIAELRTKIDGPSVASIRYYYDEDRAAAIASRESIRSSLSPAVPVRLQDFRHYEPKPSRGTVEVWAPWHEQRAQSRARGEMGGATMASSVAN